MKRYLILTTLLILTACAAAKAPIPTPSPSPAPTATVTVTPSPSATVTASPTPIQPPDFSQLPINQYLDHPLFFPDDPTCEPPCWYGLQVGQSTREDVQRVFDDTFGFHGSHQFFEEALPACPNLVP